MKDKLFNYYNNINLDDELNFRKICTIINCRIFNAIEGFLNHDIEAAIDATKNTIMYYLELAYYTSNRLNGDGLQLIDNLITLSKDITTEFNNKVKNPVENVYNLCYLIGVNSEQEENYTITSRVAILLSIIKILEIEDLIDLTIN